MSAQDDVLAAFGELPRKKQPEARDGKQAPTGQGQVGDDRAEAGAGTEAGGADAATGDAATSERTSELGPASATEEQVGGDRAEAGAETAAGAADASEPAPAEQVGDGPAETGVEAEAGAADAATASEPASAEQVGGGEPVSEAVDATPSQPNQPHQPHQPYLDPAAFFAELQAESVPQPKPSRRRLLLRYASALVLAGAVGAGTAFAVSLPRRTDVPFLATSGDGRYTFPAAARPAPPSGEPVPNNGSNIGQVHYGDLRQYLLPAPTGVAPKEDGWERVADFESSLSGSDVSNHLYDAGLRHVAWRGWTAPDGQHTVIELLQFPDHEAASDVESMLDNASLAKAGKPEGGVPQVTVRPFGDLTQTVAVHEFDQVDGLQGQVERRVVFAGGDVVAIVTTTAPAGVSDLTTEQVAMLQAEMLR